MCSSCPDPTGSQTCLTIATPMRPPASCAKMYKKARRTVILLAIRKPSVTAGLMCPPLHATRVHHVSRTVLVTSVLACHSRRRTPDPTPRYPLEKMHGVHTGYELDAPAH